MKISLPLLLTSLGLAVVFSFYNNNETQIADNQLINAGGESNALTQNSYCSSDIMHEQLLANRPGLREKEKQFEQQYVAQSGQTMTMSPPYVLPIVFHIIHQNGAENIPDAQVLDGLNHLNQAFANTGAYDPNTGTNTQIQFCLAQQTPTGGFTTGINHIQSPLTDMTMETEDINLKDVIRWDPTNYINVWVVNEICSNSSGCGVAGYAYFPSSHGNPEDGVVLEAEYMGSSSANSGVLVHELGHYLGLYHTFQGGCTNNDCMTDGDRVCDTPPDQSTVWNACGVAVNSCNTDTDSGFATDEDDMTINYMDYANLACYSAFTGGQTARMHFAIENTRTSLLDSPACSDPCLIPITALFTTAATTVNVGTNADFFNQSTGASNYDWTVNGTNIGNGANANYLFTSEGTYIVELTATNSDPNCQDSYSITINVECPVIADFSASSTEIAPGSVVYFTNYSQNAFSYQWLVNGVVVGTSQNLNYQFDALGTYDVQLSASDGICTDISLETIITVTENGLSQTGLPLWPVVSSGSNILQSIDFQTVVPTAETITTLGNNNPGATGAAFDGCGDLVFYVAHTGSSDPENLFIFAPDGAELLSNTTDNAPGLNAVRGGHEIQVIRVPQTPNEWFIIYQEWSTDVGAAINNAAYNNARLLYSKVRFTEDEILVLQRDIVLTAGGGTFLYADGMAVSRTANGDPDAHYLYAARRIPTSISLDRWVITQGGITWLANTGEIPMQYWNLSYAGSPIELSPTEDKVAVTTRNQFTNWTDFIIFDAQNFTVAAAQTVVAGDLVLVPDGEPNDQSNILPYAGAINDIAYDNSLNLNFLRNFERKLSRTEFSPNGRFLYITSGGYNSGGFTNLSYLAQIDLQASPYEVRLQVQTTPGNTYNATTGLGCSASSCIDDWRAIGQIQTGYNGKIYYSKRNDNTLHVIPNPNQLMPQNLIPSNIDLSNNDVPNVSTLGPLGAFPDQIDGFNYFLSQFLEVQFFVNSLDCEDNCLAVFELEVIRDDGLVMETLTAETCPDILDFCADTTRTYSLRHTTLNIEIDSAIVNGVVNYNHEDNVFYFNDLEGCVEYCGNGIDDDNDGLVDCDDPDLQDSCCCLIPTLVLDLGPDEIICDNGVFVLDAGAGWAAYQWSDLTIEQTSTVFGEGEYWVEVTDSCGNTQSDTLIISWVDETIVDLPDTLYRCGDAPVTLSAPGFDTYEWMPPMDLDCTDCAEVNATPSQPMTYILLASFANGCHSTDSVVIIPLPNYLIEIDTATCDGQSIVFDGQELADGTTTQFDYTAENGCDSTIIIVVSGNGAQSYDILIDTTACVGSSIVFDNETINAGESQVFDYQTIVGCDSTITVNVEEVLIIETAETITICEGESTLIFGNMQSNMGDYSDTNTSLAGCDSTHTITLEFYAPITINIDSTPFCEGSSSGGEATANVTTGGTPPYTYFWPAINQTGETQSDLAGGIYTVIVTDALGCTAEMTTTIEVITAPVIELEIANIDCFGDNAGGISFTSENPELLASLDGDNFLNVNTFGNLAAGNYTLYLQDEMGCIFEENVSIEAPQELVLNLPEDYFLNLGDSIRIIPQTNGDNLTYTWLPATYLDCDTCAQAIATPFVTTTYQLTITNENDCFAEDLITLHVDRNQRVYVPNGFSPNGDGVNDIFFPFSDGGVAQILRFSVYDRWGELIFENKAFQANESVHGWDGYFRGKPMNTGVFVWIAEVVFVDGEVAFLKGDVSLVR